MSELKRIDFEPKKSVILLSGGIDSMLCAGIAKERGYELNAISFNYGQKHRNELYNAKKIAEAMGFVNHKTLIIPPVTAFNPDAPYVPARNTIFLSYAIAYAETIEADVVFFGPNADDTAFPDCSIKYLMCWQSLVTQATKRPIEIAAPLLNLHKKDIIKKAEEMGLPLHLTTSCYNGLKCGHCSACQYRANGFKEAGLEDPALIPGVGV